MVERWRAEALLKEAAEERLQHKLEANRWRRIMKNRIRQASELGIPKTTIAELAGVDRSYVYQVLDE